MGKASLRKENDGQEQKEETKISRKRHHLANKQKNPRRYPDCTNTTKKRIPTGRRIPSEEESKRADGQEQKQEETKFNGERHHPTKKEKNPKGGSL
jgi:hypothetical protein